ncbi:uncharacterized protein LOC142328237 isoform X2 [Lycorma delicatula]
MDLPEFRPCRYCSTIGKCNKMKLYFINFHQAIYICNECDEVYPSDGVTINKDVYEQPLQESDLKQIGLPVELLTYFPTLTFSTANKIAKIINFRWRKKLNEMWNEFLEINDNINNTYDVSRKMIYDKRVDYSGIGLSDEWLFDISLYSKEEIQEIEGILDKIENKAFKGLCERSNQKNSIEVSDFFKEYSEILKHSDSKLNKQKNKSLQRVDNQTKHQDLIKTDQKIMLRKIKLKMEVLSMKYPTLYEAFVDEVKFNKIFNSNQLPKRITKDSLSKMLDKYDNSCEKTEVLQ